jgi:hypothetical protein
VPGLAQFGGGDAPKPALEIKVPPARIEYFALAGPRKEQHRHNLVQHGSVVLKNRRVLRVRQSALLSQRVAQQGAASPV